MKYFTISELTFSATARKRGINNTPNTTNKNHLIQLVDNLLNPLRKEWTNYCITHNLGTGSLKVNSGYRCPNLNTAVHGVENSAHLYGYAADITPKNGHMNEFIEWVSKYFSKAGWLYDQIIIEKSGSSRWIHFGYKNGKGQQRMQCFHLTVS
jgi:hypothetical protein